MISLYQGSRASRSILFYYMLTVARRCDHDHLTRALRE